MAEKAVAAAQVVVEETEGPPLGHGRQPERELGQFDRERVAIHAIEASLGD